MRRAKGNVTYGLEDALLVEWLNFVGALTRRRPPGGPDEAAAGGGAAPPRRETLARLWPRTKVARVRDCTSGLQLFVRRHRLTADETTVVVALLLERVAESIAVRRHMYMTALLNDNDEAATLLKFRALMGRNSKLGRRGITEYHGMVDEHVVLSDAAAAALLGEPLFPDTPPDRRKSQKAAGDCLTDTFRPRVRLDDCVLPAATKAELEDALFYVRNRDGLLRSTGLGDVLEKGTALALLFHGPPGTGKTMTAEAFAAALGKDVSIVRPEVLEDKYIGETEKNIARVFRTAQQRDLLLVFDECDSFFYARPTGRDYQNIFVGRQTNMLLRGLEESVKPVILTTNRADILEPALERRLAAKIHFPVPAAPERLALWERLLPRGHRLSEKDIGEFAAAYRLSGGDIKQAVLTAMRRAARDSRPVTAADVAAALAASKEEVGRIGF